MTPAFEDLGPAAHFELEVIELEVPLFVCLNGALLELAPAVVTL